MKFNKYGIAKVYITTKGVGVDIGMVGAFIGTAIGVVGDVHSGSHFEIR